jgi:hypothetical protein
VPYEGSNGQSRKSAAGARLYWRDHVSHQPQWPLAISGSRPASALPAGPAYLAMVAHHRIQYLLTWNCKHVANAKILPQVHDVLMEMGCPIPIICTPETMVNDDSENG